MTIKELKKVLESMPEDAEAFFTLWTSDGPRHYWFNQGGGKKIYDTKAGGKAAMIAYTDDAPAYRLFDTDKGMAYLGEK